MPKRNGKPTSNPTPAAEPTRTPDDLHGDLPGPAELHQVRPEPEVLERPTRRHYSARYKLRILEQTDGLAEGQIGAFLRREGLYWSLLSTWRGQRDAGTLAGLQPRPRGRRSTVAANPEARRVSELERENAKLQEQVRRLALVLDVQKKVLLLCGQTVADE